MRLELLVPGLVGLTLLGCDGDSDDSGGESSTGMVDMTSTGTIGTSTSGDDGPPPLPETCTPSPSYTVNVAGAPVPVEHVCKFEVPVNYVRITHPGTPLAIDITGPNPITEFTLSPLSEGIEAIANGNTLSFTATEPAYLVLQVPGQERLFVFLDPPEVNPPQIGAPEVLNVMDIPGMDNTGAVDVTSLVQGAIDGASGSPQNIVYFPPGTYTTKALFMRSNVTLYVAEGAVLQNISTPGDLLSHPEGFDLIEGTSLGYITMKDVTNANIMGRGTIDGNGVPLQEASRKMFLIKSENSSDCLVEGIIARDSAFWSSMLYRSNNFVMRDLKVVNNRLDGEWNETDGVDFNNSTNSSLTNAFLYTGDDCMAVKSDDIPDDFEVAGISDPTVGPYMNVDNITHENIVCFSGSSACKVGTKTFGDTMSNIVYRDIDVVTADRGLVIDGVDTATVTGTVFEDIRIENITGRIIDFNMDAESIFWRTTLGICSINDTSITNVSSAVSKQCRMQGVLHDWDEGSPYYGNEYYVDGVTFTNFSVAGNVITSLDDPNADFSVNDYVTNVTFAAQGE